MWGEHRLQATSPLACNLCSHSIWSVHSSRHLHGSAITMPRAQEPHLSTLGIRHCIVISPHVRPEAVYETCLTSSMTSAPRSGLCWSVLFLPVYMCHMTVCKLAGCSASLQCWSAPRGGDLRVLYDLWPAAAAQCISNVLLSFFCCAPCSSRVSTPHCRRDAW